MTYKMLAYMDTASTKIWNDIAIPLSSHKEPAILHMT